jgi:hypothetical protein
MDGAHMGAAVLTVLAVQALCRERGGAAQDADRLGTADGAAGAAMATGARSCCWATSSFAALDFLVTRRGMASLASTRLRLDAAL